MLPTLFQELLKEWHLQFRRILPWVDEKNPYKIWISEIILQQTRVEQGLPYYVKFIEAFPNVLALANASEGEVFKYWEGLGYYSRARNLHWSAKHIVQQYKGIFPDQYSDIIKLKGVGPYTAAAISSFAFSLPYAVLDGNVHRVISRIFCIKSDIATPKGRKEIQNIADFLIDPNEPGKFNQAMMDFGATVCLPASPLCEKCLFADYCQAFLTNSQKEYPFKKPKPPLRNRYFQLFLIYSDTDLILTYRKEKDVWRGLNSFPLLETADEKWKFPEEGLAIAGIFIQRKQVQEKSQNDIQLLTHQRVHLFYHLIKLSVLPQTISDNDLNIVPLNQIKDQVFPKFIHRFIEKNNYLFESK
jgi:A/G-specific adenine glycosylase